MAKGQKKSNKEVRKPKKDKAKTEVVSLAYGRSVAPKSGEVKKS